MKENKVKIDLNEEKPKKEDKFHEERENAKLRLENNKLQIELLQEKVKRLESQNIVTNLIENKEQQIIKEDKLLDNKSAIHSQIQEASLEVQVPTGSSKEAPVIKQEKIKKPKRESKGILLKLSKILMALGVSGFSFALIYIVILRMWKSIIWQISLPIGIISSLILGISFYFIAFSEKKIIELKYCPKCSYKLSKGKIEESETEIKQLYKCLNPNCDYIDSVNFEK